MADLVQLARLCGGITPQDVEKSIMTTHERTIELLKQCEEMNILAIHKHKYIPTSLGIRFYEAFKRNDKEALDDVFSKYTPYYLVKELLSKRSMSISELQEETGFTIVEIEVILRLLRYIRTDLYVIGEKYFLGRKELPSQNAFISVLHHTFAELSKHKMWGRSKGFIRVDRIARKVCQELRISLTDFSNLLEKVLDSSDYIEIHSEKTGFAFIPFSNKRISSSSLHRYYIYLRREKDEG